MQRMTMKQQKFAEEYVRSGNGTLAAINAGYSSRTAKSIANENLSKPAIRNAIKAKRAEQIENLQIKGYDYLERLKQICELKISSMFDERNRIRHPSQWDLSVYSIVKKFTIRTRKNGTSYVAVEFVDRIKVLEMIGDAIGAFPRFRYNKR